MKAYSVHRSDVLANGPWYVTEAGENAILGTFRRQDHAEMFAKALAQEDWCAQRERGEE